MFKAFKNRKNPNKDQIDELLSSYLDGVLPLDEREILEARLRQEQALMTRLEHLRQTKKALANLPNVGVPRNFILSPAMVTPTRPAAPQRQRRTWPAFGWATAAVTVLFLLVFAADVFTSRPEPALPTQFFAQGADLLIETASTADRAPEAPDMLAAEAEAAVELEMEAKVAPAMETTGEPAVELETETKVAPAMETPGEPAEKEAAAEGVIEEQTVVGAQAPEPLAEAEAPAAGETAPPPSSETREMLAKASSAPTAEIERGHAQGTTPIPGTPTPGPEGTTPANVGPVVEVIGTREAEPAAKEIPPVASPQALWDEQDSEKPTAIALLMATPETVDATSTTDGRFWLRLSEFGLGLAVISLAVSTLLLRLRQG